MELKANELRIGNYLMELTSDDIFNVSASWFSMLDVNLLCSRPIPLTEEWLIKFGFEKGLISTGNKESSGYTKDLIMMLQFQDSDIWYACPYGYPIGIERTLSVHQLQNLYFALTGKELVYNGLE